MTTNGARDVACFHCRCGKHEDQMVPRAGGGFHHQFTCSKGLPMPSSGSGKSDVELVVECPGGEPQEGFQIGGYYSHMWFERQDQLEANGCLEWMICSDGEFPSDTPETQFHLCDFRQLEQFVAFWGKELRRRGWVSDEGDDE